MALYKQAMEKAIKEKERWLATTLSSLGEAVIATDEKGIITYMNPEAEWLVGRKFHTSLNKPFDKVFRIINEDTGHVVRNPVAKVTKARSIVKIAQNCKVKAWDGAEISVTESGAPILDENDNIIGVVFVLQNITERKQTEEALQESEERYRQLVDNFPEPMVVIHEDMFVYVNPVSIKLFSATSAIEVIGKSITDFIHPDHQQEIIARLREVENGKKTQKSFRLKVVRLDGEVTDVNISPILITYHEKPAVQAVISDISEPSKIEDQLRESEEKYRNLVERSNDGIVIIQDGLLKFANSQISDITGYTIEEVLETPFTNYIHPDKLSEVENRYRRRMAGEKITPIYDSALLNKDGNRIDVELNAGLTIFQGKPADLVYIRDISARKAVENALRESEVKYRSLIETSPDAILYTDLMGKILMVNKQALMVYGCESEEEIIDKNAFEFIAPEDRERAITNAQKTLKTGGIRNIQYKLLHRDGTPYQGEISSSLITDAAGNPKGFIGIVRDISERFIVTEALSESQEKYYNLFHKSNDPIIIHDLKGKIVDVNQKMLDMFGYERTDILYSKISKLHPKSALKKSKWAFNKISKDGFVSFEIDFQRKNGETFPAEVSSSIFEISGNQVIQGIIRDVTERKQAEEIIKDSEKRYRALFEKSPASITLVDIAGAITYCNKSTEELTGYTKKELINKQFEQLLTFDPKDLPKLKKIFKKILKGQDLGQIVLEIVRKDGKKRWIEVALSIVKKGNVVVGFQVIANDITESKHAKEQILMANERLQYLLTSTSAVIYTAKTSGDYGATFISDNVKKLVGYEPTKFTKNSDFWLQRVHPKDVPRVKTEVQLLFQKDFHSYEYRFKKKDGSYIWVRDDMKLVRDENGEPLEIVGFWVDVTDRIQASK
jgi:PAS domain S-box-containing protein